MRKFTALFALLLSCLSSFGAALVPYGQLDPAIFITNLYPTVSIRSFNNTNAGNTIYVTNLYVTNIVLNGTNVAPINPTDLFIPYRVSSNTFGDSSLSILDAASVKGTNFIAETLLATKGAFMTTNFSAYLIASGSNSVTLTNISVVSLGSITASGNAQIYLSGGNGPGQHVWLLNVSETGLGFQLQSGALTSATNYFVYVRNGLWEPTQLGEALHLLNYGGSWFEIGRFNPSTNITNTVINEYNTYTNVTNVYIKSTIIYSNTTITINGTNVATINPTDGYVPYRTGTNSFGDSSLRFDDVWTARTTNLVTEHRLITEGAFITTNLSTVILSAGTNILVLTNKAMLVLASTDTNAVVNVTSGNGSGQHVWMVNYYTNATFTLPSGVCYDDTNKTVVIRGGSWTPTEVGESIELLGMPQGWVEINRSQPTGLPPAIGTYTNYFLAAGTNIVVVTNASGTNITWTVNSPISSDDHLVFASGLDTVPGTLNDKIQAGNGMAISVNGTTNDMMTIAIADQYFLWTNNAGILQPQDLTMPVMITNQLQISTGDTTNYVRAIFSHTGTNGVAKFDSQSGGTFGSPRPFQFDGAPVYISKNIGAILTVGDTTYVDVTKASQTNQVSGALSFTHATNGIEQLDLTHVRWLFNGSGSDQTLTIPSGWRTNINSAVPSKITNATITVMYLKCGGPTDTAAKQTNCYVSFEFYK